MLLSVKPQKSLKINDFCLKWPTQIFEKLKFALPLLDPLSGGGGGEDGSHKLGVYRANDWLCHCVVWIIKDNI